MIGDKILEKLREEIPQVEYERYIKCLNFDEESSMSDTKVFTAPNPFIANWVKIKYAQKISKLFETIVGISPTIQIDVKSNSEVKSLKNIQESISKTHNKQQLSLNINPSFTFDSFVVGSSNQFAYTTALKTAQEPGIIYNPLFIYGGVGLGKTHLLHAIANYNLNRNKKVIYVTIEQFMNDFTYNLQNQTMDRFREKYRECDILLIDDIQFLSKKNETQTQLFHTFNELHQKQKQIVMTADQAPKMIAYLEDRLKSRFEWGLTVDIQPPEFETKIAIIKKKCELDGVHLKPDVINYIATKLDNNIREIEGIIIKLNAFSKIVNQEITLDFTKNVLSDHIKEERKNITIENIIEIVSKELNIKPSEIKSKSKGVTIANVRRIVIYLSRNLTLNSTPSLAQYFGMKDHSSVSHAMKKITSEIESDENFKLLIENLKNKILNS
ncbi:MAG: chromosomal replication initiator protein DnaA [Campylobacterales bacterium]|nr:chromosomal replication initiator protein DnaA [Campylobacterales bacterium]